MKNQYKDILATFSKGFPLLGKIYELYQKTPELSPDENNTLRRSVEMTVLEILELIVVASRQGKEAKENTLKQVVIKLGVIKVFIDLARQTGVVKEVVSKETLGAVNYIEKMVEGWVKALKNINENHKRKV